METIIEYFSSHGIVDILWVLLVIVSAVICIEKLIKWFWDIFIKAYNKKRGHEEEISTIDKNTEQIKNLANTISNLADLLNKQYQHLDKKIDEQKERITKIDEEGKKRDCALLRDRILGGMRYFSQNKDEHGNVHVGITDHENMEHLFEEYFNCHGNGTVKSMYENEFKKFIIDK